MGDYIFRGLSSAGDSIADAIERKKQRDAFAKFQQTPSTVTQNPTTSNGDYAFGVAPTKAPNPDYNGALLNYLSQSGTAPNILAQMSMQMQQQQLPKYTIQNDEGGGHTTYRTDFGGQPKVVEQQPPLFRPPTSAPDWSVANDQTGKPIQMQSGNDILFKYTKPNPLNPNSPLEKWEKAGSIPTPNPTSVNNRLDNSYKYHNGELDKLSKPLEDLQSRVERLNATLDQKSPQADALVAPELLTAMAGGQGSGLRMNEAEISRIVGGRSNWEGLKAAIQQWSTNPELARSITPDQDKQIRALVSAANSKYQKRLSIIEGGRAKLINATSPEEHKQIFGKVKQDLNELLNPSGGSKEDRIKNAKSKAEIDAILNEPD